MVNSSDMYILNGRTSGNLSGKYTFHGHRGSSTIDYFLIDISLVRKVIALKVLDHPWFSDHCPLALT